MTKANRTLALLQRKRKTSIIGYTGILFDHLQNMHLHSGISSMPYPPNGELPNRNRSFLERGRLSTRDTSRDNIYNPPNSSRQLLMMMSRFFCDASNNSGYGSPCRCEEVGGGSKQKRKRLGQTQVMGTRTQAAQVSMTRRRAPYPNYRVPSIQTKYPQSAPPHKHINTVSFQHHIKLEFTPGIIIQVPDTRYFLGEVPWLLEFCITLCWHQNRRRHYSSSYICLCAYDISPEPARFHLHD